jgi:hypothetical protein
MSTGVTRQSGGQECRSRVIGHTAPLLVRHIPVAPLAFPTPKWSDARAFTGTNPRSRQKSKHSLPSQGMRFKARYTLANLQRFELTQTLVAAVVQMISKFYNCLMVAR